MANKGEIKTQLQYENEEELRKLYREAFLRSELTSQDVINSLVAILGYGKSRAEVLVKDWEHGSDLDQLPAESSSIAKNRLKRQMSLESKIRKRRYKKKKKQ